MTHHSFLPRLTCLAFICIASNPSHLISSHSRLRCSKTSLPVLLPSSVLLCLRSMLQSELTKVYFITSSSSELVMHFNLFCLPQSLLSSASLYIEVSCWGCFFFFSQPWVGGHLRGVVQLLCSAVFVSLCENNLFGQKEIQVDPQLERTFLYTVRSKDEDGQTGCRERLQPVKVTACKLFASLQSFTSTTGHVHV